MRERTIRRRLIDRFEGKGITLGERISYWQNKNCISDTELAHKAAVSVDYLHQIKVYGQYPSLSVLRKISAALEVTVEELFGRRP